MGIYSLTLPGLKTRGLLRMLSYSKRILVNSVNIAVDIGVDIIATVLAVAILSD